MILRALLLVCAVKCIEQTDVILSPEFNEVWENNTLELTCCAPKNSTYTTWGIFNQAKEFSYLSSFKEGACETDGFLADTEFFETRCYSNATFKVKIKRVDVSYHGQKWFCNFQFYKSNTAFISVQVPIKYVKITNISGNSFITQEKTITTLYCETSEGRPAANISWTKVSKKGIWTDITNDVTYKVSTKETLTDRNLTIVRSSIFIDSVSEDNGTRIICGATNRKSYEFRKEITLYVQYQSEIEMFCVIGHEKGKVIEVTENETVTLKCGVYNNPASNIVLLFEEKELRHNSSAETLIHAFKVTSCFDDGVYKCVVRNNDNSKQSLKKLRLMVRCTPLISPEFNLKTSVSSAQNETVTLQFKAIAYPIPKFYWFKFNVSYWYSLKSNNKYKINSSDLYSNLSISGMTEKDIGVYKLRIQNSVGAIEQLYHLTAKEFPSLTEKAMQTWMYTIYTSGGMLTIIVVFVVTWFSRKRWLKQHSTDRALDQNVQLSDPETNNIYHTSTHVVIHKDRNMCPTRKAAANVPLEMTERQQENKIFQNQQELDLELEEQFSEASEYYYTLELISRQEKLKVTELYHYVNGRTDESFRADFQKIPTVFLKPCSFARTPENIEFNRYRDILPYDHTRVCIDDQPDFFINASYIDGYMLPKAYIACLGPTASTHDNFKTFWKMVWHEQSEIIVMVTNLNEPSGMKCEQYWPDEDQDEMYGDILVWCQKIEMFAEYTIRSFEVTKATNTETSCRRLVHLHYTAWPDKKTPEDATSLLEFRHKFEDIRKTVNSPVIVHCSAGIGRTGVFIAIDRLIMQGNTEGRVNVVACITKMREQRMKMVQTGEQYKFIFQSLAYALNFDCVPIPIESLKENNEIANETYFDRQYKELQLSLESKSKEQIDSRAKNEIHNDKNRHGADIPDNTNRVYLYLNRSYGDSDYINAVFINSFKCKDYFIMAQSPLPGTESDFLTMIYQENCFCVVSMEDFNDHGMKIGKYIIEEKQSLDIGSFTVSCFKDNSKPQYTVWKVTIKNKDQFQDSKCEQYFYHFQYNNWTDENDYPPNAEEFVELVRDVQEYASLGQEKSHVLVHCLKANKRSGLFCAIAIIREKLLFDGQVSVMNILRHLRTRRSSAITSMEQLKFCYKAAGVIAKTQNEGLYINN